MRSDAVVIVRIVFQNYAGKCAIPGWAVLALDHVLGNARLSDLKPKLEQFAMNTLCSPKRVFYAHPPDQPAKIRLDLWPPSSRARLPTPIAAKAGFAACRSGERGSEFESPSRKSACSIGILYQQGCRCFSAPRCPSRSSDR